MKEALGFMDKAHQYFDKVNLIIGSYQQSIISMNSFIIRRRLTFLDLSFFVSCIESPLFYILFTLFILTVGLPILCIGFL